MAKRNPRSEADELVTAAPQAPAKERRTRSRGARSERPTARGEAPAAISDTQAARPTPEDSRPPAGPGVLEAHQTGRNGEPSDEEIRARAYRIYIERGGEHGLHEADWYKAERELKKRK